MRNFYLSVVLMLGTISVFSQSVGISNTAITPDASSIFEVRSTNKGVLIPRVSLTITTSAAPVTTPAVSLLVYNSATINDVTPGYYYWNGSSWQRFFTGPASLDWTLLGNAGTNPGTNFMGTTDAQDLVFRTNNTERMRIESGGYVGIGIINPSQPLHVSGNVYSTGDYLLNSGHYLGINGDYNIYIDDANPTWHSNTYGGVIEMRGDNDVNSSKVELGGLEVNRDIQIDGGLHDGASFGNLGDVLVSNGVGDIEWANPDVDCDDVADGFESGYTYWYNVGGDDFDWIVFTGSTSSASTGPTASNEGAYYTYVETSSTSNGDIIYLQSEMETCGNPSISFDYHMYFNAYVDGTLLLQVSNNGGTTWTTLWTMTGDQGNVWHNDQTVSLAAYANSSIILRFSFTTGANTSFQYDCALDDIKLYDVNINAFPNEDDWHVIGNANTDPSTNFLGTTDNQALVIRTNNIESMRIQSDGTVSIGSDFDANTNIYNRIMSTNTTNAYNLYNYHDGAYTGTTYGIYNTNYSSTNSTKYGIYNNVNSEGTGGRYGIQNYVYQNSTSTSSVYGFYNYLNSYGTTAYGQYNYNYIYGTSGNKYGHYTNMLMLNDPNTSTIYGDYLTFDYSSGIRYGEYKDFNTSATYYGTIYSDYSFVDGTGNDTIYGCYADITNTGTGAHYGAYFDVPGGTNDYAVFTNAGNSIFNEIGGDYDMRVETDNQTHALWVDANEDLVRFGTSSTGSDYQNGSTIGGTVVDYVIDCANGSFEGTAVGVGSMEYLLDASAHTLINNDFCPTTNGLEDLGYGTASEYWDDVYATSYVTVSDARAKEDIEDLEYGLDEILQLRPVSYKLRNDPMHDTELGLIAQELLPVISEAVKTHDYKILSEETKERVLFEMDMMGVTYMELIPVLIKALQEEDAKVEALEKQVDDQQKSINELQQKNAELESRMQKLEDMMHNAE